MVQYPQLCRATEAGHHRKATRLARSLPADRHGYILGPQPWDALPAIAYVQVCFPSPGCFIGDYSAIANIFTELKIRTQPRYEFNNNP